MQCLFCRSTGPTRRVRITLAGVKRPTFAYLCRVCGGW